MLEIENGGSDISEELLDILSYIVAHGTGMNLSLSEKGDLLDRICKIRQLVERDKKQGQD